jgi:hypothetical protein
MSHLSSVKVTFCQASLLSQCQALASNCLVQLHCVCIKCLSVSHAVQRMLVPVLLIHLGMRLLMLLLCFYIVAEHIGCLRGWMKAHKLLYVCFKQHASYIMYCEKEIQKIQNLCVYTEWTVLYKGTSVRSWTESIVQCMQKSLLFVVVFLCKVAPLPCLFNRSRFLPMP